MVIACNIGVHVLTPSSYYDVDVRVSKSKKKVRDKFKNLYCLQMIFVFHMPMSNNLE